MKDKNNENIALLTGLVLIIFVVVFTLFRDKIFPKVKTSSSNNSSFLQDNSLEYETISPGNLNKKIITEKKESFTLLDIRKFESYAEEHILDTVNIPLDEFPVASKIDSHSLIIVIGQDKDDKDINDAVKKLKEEKIENIRVLAGGMSDWKQLIGATVTYGNPKSFVDQSKVSYVNPEDLKNALTQKVPVYIVDVRTPEEFAKGHISGAKNIPFDDLEKKRAEISEKKVVVVGINELQEFQASVQMYDMLLVSPFVMRGAMPKWEENKFPLQQ